jgi:hypothetical protein
VIITRFSSGEEARYETYCAWCRSLGVVPASLNLWREVQRKISEGSGHRW